MLYLYDSQHRQKLPFVPERAPKVTLYSCGPTVYARQHLGNLRPYVFADTLRRTLELCGYESRQVINVTDVGHLTDDGDEGDDKLELSARAARRSAWDIAHEYTALFQRDLELVGVQPPDVWAFATKHIQEQIELIQLLEARGYTYRTDDGIYFDTSRVHTLGRLSALARSELRAQARVKGGFQKRRSTDFALWKLSPTGEKRQMEWQSPWGVGFPGWHTECAAMATKHLGTPIDIHTGGVDHIAVHHENEILQAEAAYGVTPWVRTWMHSEWVMLGGAKLAKRDGGAPNLDDVVAHGYHPRAYRLLLLGAHYRAKLHFSWQGVEAASRALLRLRERTLSLGRAAISTPSVLAPADLPLFSAFKSALANDLDTPKALSILFQLVDARDVPAPARYRSLLAMDAALGLNLADPNSCQTPAASTFAGAEELLAARDRAREVKNWQQADELRRQITALGYGIEDTATGARLIAIKKLPRADEPLDTEEF